MRARPAGLDPGVAARRGRARRLLSRAQRAAFDALLGPVWGQVQDLHHAEFVRRAVQLAETGAGPLLAGLLPGARLDGGTWELPGRAREIGLGGRGLLLLPTFHWSGGPLLSDLPDRPVVVTYPAGPASRSGPRAARGRRHWRG
ncbi:hypothetical protein [Kitasatospora cheerisanensis]|uniref:hypothetical protein n=1 Tax=Kitasatospora cheerisanensis TaxID=81942 RepID=UPI00268CF1C8